MSGRHPDKVGPAQLALALTTGYQLFEQGRLDDARDLFEGLSLLDPENAYIHGILGTICQKQGDDDVALLYYAVALDLFPDNIDILVNRGELLLKRGMFEDAAQDLRAAIALDPESKDPAANRARLLVTMTVEELNRRVSKDAEEQMTLTGQGA